MIPEPGDANREVTVTETFHVQTDDKLTEKELKQIEAKEVDELKDERLEKTQDPLALMANSNNPYAFLAPHQDQSSFNQNYLQQPMPNIKDITDLTTAMNMALALMAKAFKLNYSTTTNNNQRISSNPRNRQIAQLGMNIGQDRQMQMVGDDELTEKELKQIEAVDQAIHTILLSFPEDIYAAVNSCETAQEICQNGVDMLPLFIRQRTCTQLITLNYLTTAMNMALALMAKAFKLNYSTPTNNNQRISSNPRNRQIAQLGNLTGYNDVQNTGNQVIQNAVHNSRV
nr:hypothetical protein [Tanacetum cinerariifolium]